MSLFYGDKYEQLYGSRDVIEGAGAYLAPAVPIAQESIDEVLKANGLPAINDTEPSEAHEVALRIQKSFGLPRAFLSTLIDASEALSIHFDGPVLTRSSARGDDIGTGVYESRWHGNDPHDIAKAFIRVLGSYYTDAAVNYRSRAGLDPGFSIFMQPVVGTRYEVTDLWGVNDSRKPPFLFGPTYSGNARIGTPRSPHGSVKIQQNFGSAVETTSAQAVDLSPDHNDNEALYTTARTLLIASDLYDEARSERALFAPTPTGWAVAGSPHQPEYFDRFEVRHDPGDHLTKQQVRKIFENIIGGSLDPLYLEFAVIRDNDDSQAMYIVQKGLLKARDEVYSNGDYIRANQILADGLSSAGEVRATEEIGCIIRLSGETHNGIYEFDKTEEAQQGYILCYPSSQVTQGNPIDIRRLSNVRALVDLQADGSGHDKPPQDHLIGFSDDLGIPLLTFKGDIETRWRSLGQNTIENDNPDKPSHLLSVRQGRFKVLIDTTNGKSMIVDLNT
ncbi:MAG TPA: PEP/pyruvate-binding domain-containing protein [Candidatus Saccharibacteria bacterium]|nr:PEP/pyruvate-binding domain-containing protein [Candidatus Saccharibacteria bacterium]